MLQQVKQDTKLLQLFLKELPQGLTVRHIKRSEASSENEKVTNIRVLESDQRLTPSEGQVYEQLEAKVSRLGHIHEDYKDSIKNLIKSLTPKYSLGSQLRKVVDLEKINFGEDESFTKQDSSFSPENGIVYILHFWVPWWERCQGLLKESQKMLEKNAYWKGRVKVVGLAVCPDTEYVASPVNEQKLKQIEHFRLINSTLEGCDFIKYLQIPDIPYTLILNKWGKIVYMDHPSKINLEEKVNSEINSEQDSSEVQQETIQDEQPNELLSKEEYKLLKQKIKSLQVALNESAFEGFVNVSLEKINIWKTDGTKDVSKRSKLTLCYDLDVSEEDKINKFLEHHWNTIPDYLRYVEKSKIRDPVRKLKEIKTKFYEAFAVLGVTINYPNQETQILIYDAQKQKFESETQNDFLVEAQNLTGELFEQGMENLKVYLAQFEDELQITPNRQMVSKIVAGLKQYIVLGVGKQFETIYNYKKWGSDEYTMIEHKPGQVLLLDYWTMWNDLCDLNIEIKTKQLKEIAEKWGNNVRVVSLSLALAEDAIGFANAYQESQAFIEFFFPKEKKQSDQLKYGVQQLPHYVIVDKFGTIRKIECIDACEAEMLVISYLSEETPIIKKEEEVSFQIDQNKIQQILKSEIFAQADPKHILEFQLQLITKTVGDCVVLIKKPKLTYFARDNQEQKLQPILNQLFESIPENLWTISKTISKTITIPYPGKDCAVCKKDISNEPQQYYSPFKSEHVCTECAEADDKERIGNERYKYVDTLVFINGPLSDPSVLNDIDNHKIGTNRQLSDGEYGSQLHSICCNGCGEDEVGPRYISVTARPGKFQKDGYIDYCHKCFSQLKDKASEKAQEIVSKDAKDGMVLDSLFTRVLFVTGGYNDF